MAYFIVLVRGQQVFRTRFNAKRGDRGSCPQLQYTGAAAKWYVVAADGCWLVLVAVATQTLWLGDIA